MKLLKSPNENTRSRRWRERTSLVGVKSERREDRDREIRWIEQRVHDADVRQQECGDAEHADSGERPKIRNEIECTGHDAPKRRIRHREEKFDSRLCRKVLDERTSAWTFLHQR